MVFAATIKYKCLDFWICLKASSQNGEMRSVVEKITTKIFNLSIQNLFCLFINPHVWTCKGQINLSYLKVCVCVYIYIYIIIKTCRQHGFLWLSLVILPYQSSHFVSLLENSNEAHLISQFNILYCLFLIPFEFYSKIISCNELLHQSGCKRAPTVKDVKCWSTYMSDLFIIMKGLHRSSLTFCWQADHRRIVNQCATDHLE